MNMFMQWIRLASCIKRLEAAATATAPDTETDTLNNINVTSFIYYAI